MRGNSFKPSSTRSRSVAAFVSFSVVTSLTIGTAAAADTAQQMHDVLKERWYTTEMIVFRTKSSGTAADREATLLEGAKLSRAEEREQLGTMHEIQEVEPGEPDLQTVKVITDDLSDTDLEQTEPQRPALDAEPWEGIRDYDGADDLGELVARNMATWETQLRAREGTWLAPEELSLADAAKKLAGRSNLEILLHAGWTQAVPDRDSGQPVEIATEDTYLNPVTNEVESRLSGSVTVTLGRYLHVQPTLFYTPEFTPAAASLEDSQMPAAGSPVGNENQIVAQARAAAAAARGGRVPDVRDLSRSSDSPNSSGRSALDRLRDRETQDRLSRADRTGSYRSNPRDDYANVEAERPPYIRLDESRRVRSGELHYLDHPELGVLVRITPVVADPLLQEQFALLQ